MARVCVTCVLEILRYKIFVIEKTEDCNICYHSNCKYQLMCYMVSQSTSLCVTCYPKVPAYVLHGIPNLYFQRFFSAHTQFEEPLRVPKARPKRDSITSLTNNYSS